jgi:hypothetical protein
MNFYIFPSVLHLFKYRLLVQALQKRYGQSSDPFPFGWVRGVVLLLIVKEDVLMARLMADKEFKKQQGDRRYDTHVALINYYVDHLSSKGQIPYVAPLYGGVNATLLSILRDPGPMTQNNDKGSGFICMENDDQTAEALYNHYKAAGISACDIVPWNAYPWYINKEPSASQLKVGAETISYLLTMLKNLRVVMLHGNAAHKAWDYLPEKVKEVVSSRNIEVIKTFHTSRMAFISKDPDEVLRRKRHVTESFQKAASILSQTD